LGSKEIFGEVGGPEPWEAKGMNPEENRWQDGLKRKLKTNNWK